MAVNGVLNVHDTNLTNLYFGQGSDNLSKSIGPWIWNKDFGSSAVPYAVPVNINGNNSCNVNINDLTKVNTSSCSCIKQNWFPIASECGCGNIFGFNYSYGLPAGYYTRTGQALDKTDALNIYDNQSWSTIIKGSLKSNLIDMMSTPAGTVQTFGLAANCFKGVCGLLGSGLNFIKGLFA